MSTEGSGSVLSSSAFAGCRLVINPTRYPAYIKKLKRITRRTGIEHIVESRNKEHFIACVREFCAGPEKHLLVWGGDGTAHDAINAYMASREAGELSGPKAIGFLRGGSGNGIQDSYEVPFFFSRQLSALAESVANDYVQTVDLLRVVSGDTAVYGQLVGVGFDAELLAVRSARKARFGRYRSETRPGFLNYMTAGLVTFARGFDIARRTRRLELLNGKYGFRGTRVNAEFPIERLVRMTNAAMIEIGTRPYYGRMFKVCPDVVCNDGLMDVYVFNFQSRREIVRHMPALWQGRHHAINSALSRKRRPVIERYEVAECNVSEVTPFSFHVDGELFRADLPAQVTVEIIPLAVPFIVPGSFYHKFHPFEGELDK